MGREIKFRGKRIDNGEWVYGYYVHIDYNASNDYVEGHLIILSNGHDFGVDPKTVGQYTGLKGKNGVEIYEGDILKTNGLYRESFIVGYSPPSFCLEDNSDGVLANECYSWEEWEKSEVIGNMHDKEKVG